MEFIKVHTEPLISETSLLARKIWTEHYESIVGSEQVEYMLEKFQSSQAIIEQINKGWLYYILSDGEQWLGYIALLPEPATNSMHLSKYYVDKKYRGKGYGKESMEFIKTMCREMNFKDLWLTVCKYNSDSIAIYEKLGFTNAGPISSDIGSGFVMDDYKMTIKIS